MTKVAIIGRGFVGTAVAEAFVKAGTTVISVDPAFSPITIQDLPDDLTAAFICVPTPVSADGSVDTSIAESVFAQLVARYGVDGDPIVVAKSTMTPEVLREMGHVYERFVFQPEFLTERNAYHDFVEPSLMVYGVANTSDPYDQRTAIELETLYEVHSMVDIYNPECTSKIVSIESASLIKYGINSFLATKVAFFNELKEVSDATYGAVWDEIRQMVGDDERIGHSHTNVPGPDGKRGFGGACFIKDTAALYSYSKAARAPMDNLGYVVETNASIRLGEGVDSRELAQKITPELLVGLTRISFGAGD